MQPPRSIADIPFRRRDARELLNLHLGRATPDPDYDQFGHGRLDSVWLEETGGGAAPRLVEAPLIIALHSAEPAEPFADDIELEFFLHDVAPDYSVTALLSRVLERRLSEIRGDERAIVLALCNPHRAVVSRPPGLGDVALHYALGDVESWMDATGDRQVRLVADGWRIA